jgi:tRNA A-37 threonylcarbamoyl transferase component Bud32
MEHHFRIDVFTAAIDFQLQELNNRISEHAVELLILSAALSPQDAYKLFKIDDICNLVEKFYPQNFIE